MAVGSHTSVTAGFKKKEAPNNSLTEESISRLQEESRGNAPNDWKILTKWH